VKKTKVIRSLETVLNTNLTQSIDEQPFIELFKKLLKDLDIKSDINIFDNLYLQPFKLEYVEFDNGIKDYFSLDKQKEDKKDKYSKLVVKKGNKLVSVKAFGKVGDIEDTLITKIVLLIRLSQYMRKGRELYSLNISIKQLL